MITYLFLDLENTIIDSELNPVILDKNKKLITDLMQDHDVENILIFSSMFNTTADAISFLRSELKTIINNEFSICIDGVVPLKNAYDSLAKTKLSFPCMNKPSKESLFISYVDKIYTNSGCTCILVDDTIRSDHTYELSNDRFAMVIQG